MRPMNFTRARGAMSLAAVLTTTAAAGVSVAYAQAPGLPGTPESRNVTPAGKPTTKSASRPAEKAGPAKKRASKTRSRTTVRSVRRNVTLGKRMLVRGTVSPKGAGRRVRLQIRTRKGWQSVAKDVSRKGGGFRLRYTPKSPGSLKTRVVFLGDSKHRSSRRTIGRVNVFRKAYASWYGPGLYGNKLGCGGRLTTGTIGVAHKSLPCGTPLTVRYNGRSVRVRVIDRGPYVGQREYDLTSATRSRIGFSGHGTVLTTK